MRKRCLRTIGLSVLILAVVVTMSACEMVGNNAADDTVDNPSAGELEVVASMDELESQEIEAQNVIYERFENFRLEYQIIYQDDREVSYTEEIDLDDEAVKSDNLGEKSVTFTGLQECTYDVYVNLIGDNTETGQDDVYIATGQDVVDVIEGEKRNASVYISQETGDLNLTVGRFPCEEDGETTIEEVTIEIDGEEQSYELGEEETNTWQGLNPTWNTMTVRWQGDGDIEAEAEVRIIPGKTIDRTINLSASQVNLEADWKAEPECPENIEVTENEDCFTISWDGVDNADQYNVLLKRDPYLHDNYRMIGEVDHTGVGDSHEFEHCVDKDELMEDGEFSFKVVSVRELEGEDYNLTSEACGPESDDEVEYEEATAWAGEFQCPAQEGAWWYAYDVAVGGEQNIYANQDMVIGTVEISEPYDDNGDEKVTITMNLDDDWRLQDVAEPVKIQGYADGELPGDRPAAGDFDYKGDQLEVEVPADGFVYYAIHLDVEGEVENND